jgi:galactokinase
MNFKESADWSLDDIQREKGHHWSNYLKGVMKILQEAGYKLRGVEGVVYGDVPIASGLSSSAAIEVATAFGLQNVLGLEIDPVQMILFAQRAENKFVGVNCGIMDQFVGRLGKKDHALFLDCRSLEYDHIPLRLDDFALLIVDTKVKRELAQSAYNQRRAECDEAVKYFQSSDERVKALRDVDEGMFKKQQAELPEVVRRRARHVISENGRVIEAINALKKKDMAKVGELFYESHRSLKEDYEVSSGELDFIVDSARKFGAIGARLTGAGFGGCAIILIQKEMAGGLNRQLPREYEKKFGHPCSILILESNLETTILKP